VEAESRLALLNPSSATVPSSIPLTPPPSVASIVHGWATPAPCWPAALPSIHPTSARAAIMDTSMMAISAAPHAVAALPARTTLTASAAQAQPTSTELNIPANLATLAAPPAVMLLYALPALLAIILRMVSATLALPLKDLMTVSVQLPSSGTRLPAPTVLQDALSVKMHSPAPCASLTNIRTP
jgi:hypothetical protein